MARKKFEAGDVVRFFDKECLFKIEAFGENELVLTSLHDEFQATENEEPFVIRYTVSKDQCQRLTFVSRPAKVSISCLISDDEQVGIRWYTFV